MERTFEYENFWCSEPICQMIAMKGKTAGSRALIVSNYCHCVVLGSGLAKLGTAWNILQWTI